jgi:hypothetical protein
MTDSEQATVAILNHLHAAEMDSVLPRLLELNVRVSFNSAPVLELVKKIAEAAREHREWLVDAIMDHRGTVWPVSLDLHTGSLHYVSLDSILPLLNTTISKLVAAYAQAAQDRSLTVQANDIVNRIQRRYAEFLQQLHSAQSRLTAIS